MGQKNNQLLFYIALTYKFPDNWPVSAYGGKWGIVFQLHGPDTFGLSPAFEVTAAALQANGSAAFAVIHCFSNVGILLIVFRLEELADFCQMEQVDQRLDINTSKFYLI